MNYNRLAGNVEVFLRQLRKTFLKLDLDLTELCSSNWGKKQLLNTRLQVSNNTINTYFIASLKVILSMEYLRIYLYSSFIFIKIYFWTFPILFVLKTTQRFVQ